MKYSSTHLPELLKSVPSYNVKAYNNHKLGKIPPYIRKRKIQIIREKILVRKFAYIFYRRTVSQILPSQARMYYKRRILWKAYRKLMGNWFDNKVEWRLNMKADIHYKLTLKRIALYRWQYALLLKMETELKVRIADLHYENKTKTRLFIYWKNSKKIVKVKSYTGKVFKSYAVVMFLHTNVLKTACSNYELQIEYLSVLRYRDAFTKRMLKKCFSILRRYKDMQTLKKRNAQLIRMFRRRKYNPEQIRMHFEIWQNFTQNCVIDRLKSEVAEMSCNNKLLRKCFKSLKAYKCHQQEQAIDFQVAYEHYTTVTTKRSFKQWLMYTFYRIKKVEKTEMVREFYSNKLKKKCLKILRKYATYKIRKAELLETAEEKYLTKLRSGSYKKLRRYHHLKKIKRHKMKAALAMYEGRLLKRYFDLFKKYTQYRKSRKMSTSAKILLLQRELNMKTLSACIEQWKMFKVRMMHKKQRIQAATRKYELGMLKKCVKKWSDYVCKRRNKHKQENKVLTLYQLRLKKNFVRRWQVFLQKHLMYKTATAKAHDAYQKTLLRTGFQVIIHAASERQIIRQKIAFKHCEQVFAVALKYFKIWKYKALLHCRPGFKTYLEIRSNDKAHEKQKQVSSHWMEFQWNPLCFEQPRIPQYFMSK